MGIKKFDTILKTFKSMECRGHNFCDQLIFCVEDVYMSHCDNVLNPSKSVTKISMVIVLIIP